MTGRGSNDRYNAVLDGQGQIHYMHKSAIAHAWRMAWLFVVTPTCTCSSLGFLVEKNNSKQKKDEKKEIVRNEKKIKRTYDYVNALDFVCASDCEYGRGRGLISKKHLKHGEKKMFNNLQLYTLISDKTSPSFQKPQHLQNICQKNWNGVTW